MSNDLDIHLGEAFWNYGDGGELLVEQTPVA
ncbi:hypothetical protein ABIF63_008016 [Bradyrhizobium japonicum]|uniref:MBL fold metallo-hydrolase n=1 Tax=Bradyrhizobium japonicum TaxID=375 RepID=A0ABV2S5W1_BRAJP|nr:hypothetical protein [Bradyrhizobium japonicum]MCS3985760.1 hypothetical protein [Bradyrhizobium japonicum]MCS4019424.1 hypothetical protein [Bradyrhizobium japonicum]MCS4206532.1 hypothetical protein [Bradyrhizobium japonicum]